MSWQLLVPIAEKLLDAGISYYNSEKEVAKAPEITDNGVVILLTAEADDKANLVENIKEALSKVEGLNVKGIQLEDANGAG